MLGYAEGAIASYEGEEHGNVWRNVYFMLSENVMLAPTFKASSAKAGKHPRELMCETNSVPLSWSLRILQQRDRERSWDNNAQCFPRSVD